VISEEFIRFEDSAVLSVVDKIISSVFDVRSLHFDIRQIEQEFDYHVTIAQIFT